MTSKYTGETNSKGQRHGHGTLSFSDPYGALGNTDGATYTGEWKDGMENGQGTLTDADGSTYTGEWKDDKPHGQGTMTYADGGKYTGAWKKGVPVP